MKDKLEGLIAAVLIVVCSVFILACVTYVIPKYWLTAILLIYGVYLVYRVINPKRQYYFVTFWLSGEYRGRAFISCDKFKVYDMEKSIAQKHGAEEALIDYYRRISKEEYECQKE